MLFIVRISIVILLYSVAASCESVVNPIDEKKHIDTLYSTTHFLWPANVGNSWDYKGYNFMNHFSTDSNWTYEGFDSFGLDLDTVQSEPSLYMLEIVDSIFINIRDTMYSCHVFDGYDPVTEKYRNLKSPYWIGDDGIYNMGIYVERKDSVFSKGLYIPSEIPLNENWGGQIAYRIDGFLLQTKSVVERKCLSKNEVLITPMGAFECYVIFTRIWMADDIAGYYDYYNYYAPGVGMVCTIRLGGVTPGAFPDGEIQWWLDYIAIINNYSIN
ncbi:MAG: hypothetical protein KKG93_04175 [Bacteroidetes bacterium]|nr:hypothetical protein [Bacteroidota bacterium]